MSALIIQKNENFASDQVYHPSLKMKDKFVEGQEKRLKNKKQQPQK